MVIANTSQRLYLVSALIATLLSLSTAASATNFYPPCQGQQNGNCDMTDTGNKDVMTGDINISEEGKAVPLYLILYGPWTSSYDEALTRALGNLVGSLNDSVYEAIQSTYSGPSGTAPGRLILNGIGDDSNEQFGTSLTVNTGQTEGTIAKEIAFQINQGNMPVDPNAVYVILMDEGVSFPGYCSNGGGFNSAEQIQITVPPVEGTYTLHFAIVGNAQGCPSFAWHFPTPNNTPGCTDNVGAIDAVLSAVVHEINEAITDPGGGNGGWWSSGTGNNDQMADFCVGLEGNTYGPNTPCGYVTANYHNAYGDFMIQPLRVNALFDGNYQGYCVDSYGGVFYNANFGYQFAPNGDWSPGNYKGECQPDQPMIGLSQNLSTGTAHAIMCDVKAFGGYFPQSSSSCSPSPFAGMGTFSCFDGQYLAGLAQSGGGVVNTLLCCAPEQGYSLGNCTSQPFNSQALAESDSPYDWDWGYLKADCPSGQYMGGLTIGDQGTDNNVPTGIQCCDLLFQ
jgi:hypothetical protein